ncbi:MAG TPA: lysylphosphatidylglycerol synthase domain-containing protein [Polyangiaceae bacterium]
MALFLLGVAVVCRLFARVGVHSVVALLGNAGPSVAFVFAAPVVGQLLNLLAWTVLLPQAARPHPIRGYRVLLAAQAGNELGASILGEPLKVIALPSRHRDAAAAAVVLDNVVCFAAVCSFLVVGGAVLSPFGSMSTDAPHALKWASLIVVAVMVSFVVGGSLVRSARSAIEERLKGTFRACRFALRERPRAIAAAFLLHVAAKLWVFAEFWLALRLFGHGSLRESALLGVASIGGSMMGAPVPAQLGVVESAVAVAAATAGIPTLVALAVLVLRRVRGFFWILAGALLLPTMKGSP